ncbi:MAG: hypothetical protein JWR26_1796 [Pedosphaera sp.]|nr:hypothetical protein [Pedosphaera sp.]
MDVAGNFTTNFNGPVLVSGFLPTTAPTILITEVETINKERIELSNLSLSPVDVGGWRVFFYDHQSWPMPKAAFTIPSGTTCPAKGVFEVRDNGTFPGAFPVFFSGVGLIWNNQSLNNQVAVLLVDNNGRSVDFFCAVDGYSPLIKVPSVITAADWASSTVSPNANPALSYQRSGHINHHDAADWIIATNTFGTFNPSLGYPFIGAFSAITLSPSSLSLTNGLWSGSLIATTPGTNAILRADDGAGHSGDSGQFNILGLQLGLQVPHQAFKATAGLLGQALVSIPQPLSTTLTVAISNTLPNLIVAPANLTILAGATNAPFAITNLDDGLLEGPQVATITVMAPGYVPASDAITNYDRQPVDWSISMPSSISEASGWQITGRIRSALPVATNVAVNLSSSNPGKLQVPDFVLIPAGQTNANFSFAAIYNPQIDGNKTVLVSATVPGWGTNSFPVVVRDNENTGLVLAVTSQVNEGVGLMTNFGTIRISGTLTTNLTVSLTNDAPGKMLLPASVVIPAGQTSAAISATFPDDGLKDLDQFVTVTATAPGFATGIRGITIVDNHPYSFAFGALPAAQLAGRPFTVTVSSLNKTGRVVPGYSGTINLSASGTKGIDVVTPAVIGPFTNGTWSGTVTVASPNQNVILTADDGAGDTGVSTPFDVGFGQMLNLPVSDMVYDTLRGKIWVGVQSGAATNAQRVVAIDPATGIMGAAIPLNDQPGKLAISADGQFLYCGLMSTGGVARINLNLNTVDLKFGLVPGNGTFALQMAVLPGDSQSLVVQLTGNVSEAALYKNGVLRTNAIGPAPYPAQYAFAFNDSPTNFFMIYSGALRWVNANSSGLTLVREIADLQYDGSLNSAGSLIFDTTGAVYGSRDFRRLGSYGTPGLEAVDLNADEVFILPNTVLQTFDLAAFAPLGQQKVPISSNTVANVMRCGANRIAISTTSGQLLLLQPDSYRISASADLSLAISTNPPPVTIVGSNFVYSFVISNAGPASVTNATFVDVLPADVLLISATSSAGSCLVTNGIVSCNPGLLSNGASATIQLIIQPQSPGQLVNSAWVAGDGINLSNSVSQTTNTVIFGPVLPAVTRIGFNSDSLAYDPSRNFLWASVERFDNAQEFTLRSIDLNTGLPQCVIPLGFPSSKIAISANAQYLYAVYVNDQDNLNYTPDNFVGRANLSSNIIDMRFPVVDAYNQEHAAVDMIGISSYPTGVIISRAGPQDDIALYVNGVAISRAPSDTGPGKLETNPAIPTRFYRLAGGNIQGNLDRLDIGSSAISVLNSANLFATPPVPGSPVARDIRFGAGFLFSDAGIVADPEAMTNVAQLPITGLVQTDPTSGLVFYLVQVSSQWVLTAFDMNTFAPAWSFNIPGIVGTPSKLTRCSPGVLAFRTDADQVFILNTLQMPHILQSDLSVAQTVSANFATTNTPVTFTTTLTNAGPSPAKTVALTNQLPANAIILGISSSQGTTANVSNNITCTIGDFQAGASAWLQVIATLNQPGIVTNNAGASQTTPDSITANNIASTTVQFTNSPVSDLSVVHFAPPSNGQLGSTVAYTLIVSNAGPDISTNVTLTDTILSGASMASATVSQGTFSLSGGVATANLGALGSGMTATMNLMLNPSVGGMVQSIAQVGGENLDLNLANNQSFTAISLLNTNGVNLIDEIATPVTDIAYDTTNAAIIANTPASSGPYPNSVVGIDARNGALKYGVLVGNQLDRIALSDDNRYAYSSLSDTGGIARVDVPARAVDLRFALNTPAAPFGPYLAEDIAVMPGSPGTLAAARGGYSGYLSAVALFDSGIQRPDTLDSLNPNATYFRIRFADANSVYTTSPFGFQAATVTPTGLTNQGSLFGGYTGEFAVGGGLVFLGDGNVIDPATGNLIVRFPATGLALPDLAHGRVYFFTNPDNGGYLWVRAFDWSTKSELWSFQLNSHFGYPKRIIDLGTNGLGLFADANVMFILRTPQMTQPVADLSISETASPNPVVVGSNLTYTVNVQNLGPWTATGAIVTNPLPPGVSFVSATSTLGNCLFTNGAVICNLGNITNTSLASITLTIIPNSPGPLTNYCTVGCNEIDPTQTNNSAMVVSTVNAPPPLPSVSIGDATVNQGFSQTTVSFGLTLSRSSPSPISFGYQTANGTALAGQDYDAASGVFTFNPGVTSSSLNLPIIHSNFVAVPSSFFYLNLLAVTNASLVRTQAVATIVEHVFRTVAISGQGVIEGNGGVTNALFALTLSSPNTIPVSVQYQTVDGTATGSSDYLARSGVMIFPAGITNVTLAVPVLGDTLVESDETFSVTLSQPQNAILGVNEATGIILNDDAVPPISFTGIQLAGPTVWLQFSTIQGRLYRIEKTNGLSSGTWTPISGPIMGTGAPMSVSDSYSASSAAFFYRLVLLP